MTLSLCFGVLMPWLRRWRIASVPVRPDSGLIEAL